MVLSVAAEMWKPVIRFVAELPDDQRYTRVQEMDEGNYVPGATKVATVVEFNPSIQSKDVVWLQTARENDTKHYHRMGNQQVRYQPSTIPEGVTLGSLMKLLTHDTTSKFDPFFLRLEKFLAQTLSAHDLQAWTTWVFTVYKAVSTSNSPLDQERCEVVNMAIAITNRLVSVMEAIIAGDAQRALARTIQCYLPLLAFMARMEARRYTANNNTTVVEEVLAQDHPPVPPTMQALAL